MREPVIQAPHIDLAAIRARCERTVIPADLYERYASMAMLYGASHRSVEELRTGTHEACALLCADITAAASYSTWFAPGLLDGALQCVLALTDVTPGTQALPFTLESAQFHSPCGPRMWAWVRRCGTASMDIDVCDEAGSVALRCEAWCRVRKACQRC